MQRRVLRHHRLVSFGREDEPQLAGDPRKRLGAILPHTISEEEGSPGDRRRGDRKEYDDVRIHGLLAS